METNKKCLISSTAIQNNFEIKLFYRLEPEFDEDSGWIFLSGNEDSSDEIIEENLSTIILNAPFVRPYLDKPIGSSFVIDESSQRILDYSPQKTFSFDRKVYAPNAAGVRLEPLVWMKHNPAKLFLPTLTLLFFVLAIVYHWAIGLIAAYFLVLIIADWVRTFEHFKFGDSLPGLVVSTKPTLIAVTTDFSSNERQTSVIKIFKVNIRDAEGNRVGIGDRIGTVVIYKQPQWYDSRIDIYPMPINYATSNSQKINKVLEKYDESEWTELKERLEQIKKPYKVGLFEITADKV